MRFIWVLTLLVWFQKSFYSALSLQNSDAMKTGLIVIPGLGRNDRLQTVIHNLNMLKSYIGSTWDCVVYIYAPREDTLFWGETEKLDYVKKYCRIVEHPRKRFTENLFLVQPALLKSCYKYLFILLDDQKLLGGTHFPLNKMLEIMEFNSLSVASPKIIGANKGADFRKIMQANPKDGTLGYISNFIEIFAWLTTVDAYEALWELLWPPINPYGWGYDFWYDGYSRERLKHHKMGIISAIEVLHEQNITSIHSKTGRTDNTNIDVKWNAVLKQEKFYQKFKNITLKRYRSSLRIGDGSVQGPVSGYIQAPGNNYEAYVKTLYS